MVLALRASLSDALRKYRGAGARATAVFTARSDTRDAENDQEKRDRILSSLTTVAAELAAEKTGLRSRFEAAQSRASAVLGASEAEGDGHELTLTELESAMMYCERRIRQIDKFQSKIEALTRLAVTSAADLD